MENSLGTAKCRYFKFSLLMFYDYIYEVHHHHNFILFTSMRGVGRSRIAAIRRVMEPMHKLSSSFFFVLGLRNDGPLPHIRVHIKTECIE